MPSFTKKAIVESFLRLAGKKPLDKITVRDIVDDCGINRNTFYYYFQDIYAVLEELGRFMIGRLPTDASLSVTLEAFFDLIAKFAAHYPKAVKGLIMSLGSDGLERYLGKDLDHVILSCLMRESGEKPYTREYLMHLTSFLRHGVFGYCLDFLQTEKSEPFTDTGGDLAHILEAVSAAWRGGKPDKN